MRLIILVAIAIAGIVYRLLSEKKKYENAVYLKNLQAIIEFLDVVRSFNDYVTWVQRDQIKSEYANSVWYSKINHRVEFFTAFKRQYLYAKWFKT